MILAVPAERQQSSAEWRVVTALLRLITVVSLMVSSELCEQKPDESWVLDSGDGGDGGAQRWYDITISRIQDPAAQQSAARPGSTNTGSLCCCETLH